MRLARAHVSDHAMQAAVKRANSVGEYHNTNLGDPILSEAWWLGCIATQPNWASQLLDEVYRSYQMNGELDSEEESMYDVGVEKDEIYE